MEEENLIKKLESISLSKIEIENHKEKLRLLLMEKYFPERKRRKIFGILKQLIPATAFAIILLFIFLNKINLPSDNLAIAKEIALQNTDIKNWVKEGATIKDVQIVDGKAYVLIEPAETNVNAEISTTPQEPSPLNLKSGGAAPSEEVAPENIAAEKNFKGALAEVDIKGKKISNIEKLAPTVTGLIEKKKEKTLKIANDSAKIQEMIPKEAQVLNISVSTPKFKLIKEGNSVSVQTEIEADEKASIIYKSDGKTWEGKINITKGKVEEIKSLDDIKNDARQDEPDH